MDFREDDEHQLLRGAVRDLAAGFGHEYFAEQARTGQKTDELWQAMADHGFLAVHLPEAFGGGGAGIQELAIVCEGTAAQGCPLLLILVTAAICAELISRFGTPDQKEEWLPGLASGKKMAFAITEPDAGSNSHQLRTVASPDGETYRINGSKTYISGVDEADQILVVTRTSIDPNGRGRLTLFIVDSDTPGLERALIPVAIAAPEKQFTLHFDNVVVPVSRRLGEEHDGLRVVFFGLNPERITGAALSAGIRLDALGE